MRIIYFRMRIIYVRQQVDQHLVVDWMGDDSIWWEMVVNWWLINGNLS